MAELNTPSGHVLGLGGNFSKRQDLITRLFKQWGARTSDDASDCTIIVAPDADNKKTLIVEGKRRGLPFLNGNWMEACLAEKKWIEPKSHHFHQEPPSVPEEQSGLSGQTSAADPGSSRESTASSETTDVFSKTAGRTTQNSTPQASSVAGRGEKATGNHVTETLLSGTPSVGGSSPKTAASKTDGADTAAVQTTVAETADAENNAAETPVFQTAFAETNAPETEAADTVTAQTTFAETDATEASAVRSRAAEIASTKSTAGQPPAVNTATIAASPTKTIETQTRTPTIKIEPSENSHIWGLIGESRNNWYQKNCLPHTFHIDVHPDDIYKPRDEQRRSYEMVIDFAIRHFLIISDPDTSFPSHKSPEKTKCNLRACWLITRQEAGTKFQDFVDNDGVVLTSASENLLRGQKMEDFDWWGTASYHGSPCYNVGVLPGETRPRVWSRTALMKVWGKAADKEINRIRKVFRQYTLDDEKELRRSTGKERSLILENLKESERYLAEEGEVE